MPTLDKKLKNNRRFIRTITLNNIMTARKLAKRETQLQTKSVRRRFPVVSTIVENIRGRMALRRIRKGKGTRTDFETAMQRVQRKPRTNEITQILARVSDKIEEQGEGVYRREARIATLTKQEQKQLARLFNEDRRASETRLKWRDVGEMVMGGVSPILIISYGMDILKTIGLPANKELVLIAALTSMITLALPMFVKVCQIKFREIVDEKRKNKIAENENINHTARTILQYRIYRLSS